jgi:hypothetical protein
MPKITLFENRVQWTYDACIARSTNLANIKGLDLACSLQSFVDKT